MSIRDRLNDLYSNRSPNQFNIVDANLAHDFFFGTDHVNRPTLVLKTPTELTTQLNLHVIDIRSFAIIDGSYKSVIVLIDPDLLPLFISFCEDLCLFLSNCSYESLTRNLQNRVVRWQEMFKRGRSNILTENEIRGLFGELHVLERIIQNNNYDTNTILSSWIGSEHSDQDFIFPELALEVKTLPHNQTNIKISSENQLDLSHKSLYLICLQLVHESSGHSLNDLEKRIIKSLSDERLIEQFHYKLALRGYLSILQYEEYRFNIHHISAYKVTHDFPAIRKSLLPHGISAVSYSINLDTLAQFQTPSPIGDLV
jgi:hypothetical protein